MLLLIRLSLYIVPTWIVIEILVEKYPSVSSSISSLTITIIYFEFLFSQRWRMRHIWATEKWAHWID